MPEHSTNVTYLLELSVFDVTIISLATLEYDEDTVKRLVFGLYRIPESICNSLVPELCTNVINLLELSVFDEEYARQSAAGWPRMHLDSSVKGCSWAVTQECRMLHKQKLIL